ncbi:hypothetical protein U1Q18_009735 [Sarracenia purpurea var. burkii]
MKFGGAETNVVNEVSGLVDNWVADGNRLSEIQGLPTGPAVFLCFCCLALRVVQSILSLYVSAVFLCGCVQAPTVVLVVARWLVLVQTCGFVAGWLSGCFLCLSCWLSRRVLLLLRVLWLFGPSSAVEIGSPIASAQLLLGLQFLFWSSQVGGFLFDYPLVLRLF